jgi:hypothetical protein
VEDKSVTRPVRGNSDEGKQSKREGGAAFEIKAKDF